MTERSGLVGGVDLPDFGGVAALRLRSHVKQLYIDRLERVRGGRRYPVRVVRSGVGRYEFLRDGGGDGS